MIRGIRIFVLVYCLSAQVVLPQGMKAIEDEITSLVDRLSQSTVSIASVSSRGHGGSIARSVGTGVVFDKGGYILTTASVVGAAHEVEVRTSGGEVYSGVVVGTDAANDLAVVHVDDLKVQPAKFDHRRHPKPGSLVFVISNSFGSLPSVSMGMLSSVGRAGGDETSGEMLRLALPVNPGDTGAPVVNSQGEVIGIILGRLSLQPWAYSVKFPDSGAIGFMSGFQPSNMSVAIPSQRAIKIAREIMEKGTTERGFLGVRVVDLTDEMRKHIGDPYLHGVLVTSVVPGSPAESIGIDAGDVITDFDGKEVTSVSTLRDLVTTTKPGLLKPIGYVKNSKRIEDTVRISRLSPAYLRYGVIKPRVEDVDAHIRALKAEIQRISEELRRLERSR